MHKKLYEPPTLIEVGDLRDVTLGNPSWGFESDFTCVIIDCRKH